MKKHIKFLTIVIFFLLINSTKGQVAFDVKTPFQEKKELHAIKIALIQSLQESNWAMVKEVGEDYSLWLKNFTRKNEDSLIVTELDLELRTPSMFSSGRLIYSKHIIVSFDGSDISNIPVQDDYSQIGNLLLRELNKSGMIEKYSSMFANFIPIPFMNILVSRFLENAIKELPSKPTPLESLESNLTGAQIMIVVNQIMK